MRLRLRIEQLLKRFGAAKKREKTQLCLDILNEIKGKGGRFLKKGESHWEIVEDSTARAKIAHDFRTFKSSQIKAASKKESAGTKKKSRDTEDTLKASQRARHTVDPAKSSNA